MAAPTRVSATMTFLDGKWWLWIDPPYVRAFRRCSSRPGALINYADTWGAERNVWVDIEFVTPVGLHAERQAS